MSLQETGRTPGNGFAGGRRGSRRSIAWQLHESSHQFHALALPTIEQISRDACFTTSTKAKSENLQKHVLIPLSLLKRLQS